MSHIVATAGGYESDDAVVAIDQKTWIASSRYLSQLNWNDSMKNSNKLKLKPEPEHEHEPETETDKTKTEPTRTNNTKEFLAENSKIEVELTDELEGAKIDVKIDDSKPPPIVDERIENAQERFERLNLNLRKVVEAKWSTAMYFKIPEGLDLSDKTKVKKWYVRFDERDLAIVYTDGTQKMMKVAIFYEPKYWEPGSLEIVIVGPLDCCVEQIFDEEDTDEEDTA